MNEERRRIVAILGVRDTLRGHFAEERGEMVRISRSGRRVAMLPLIIALLGASVWAFPVLR
jgi:hypothetical protein